MCPYVTVSGKVLHVLQASGLDFEKLINPHRQKLSLPDIARLSEVDAVFKEGLPTADEFFSQKGLSFSV